MLEKTTGKQTGFYIWNEMTKKYTIQPPNFVRSILPQALWRVNTLEKVVFLTFDDGPTPGVTEKVLFILEKFNAKATFFCIGKNVRQHPKIYQQLLKKGHSVGNHTNNHVKGWRTPNNKYFDNIEKCAQVIKSNLFRPPYGRITPSQYNWLKQRYTVVMWDVLSYDWKKEYSSENISNNVLEHVRPGSIIVYHDSEKAKKNCLESLPQVLNTLREKGYSFASL